MSRNLVDLADADVLLAEAAEEARTILGSADTIMKKIDAALSKVDKARDVIKVIEKDHADLDAELERMSIERDVWKEKFEKLWDSLPKEQQVAIQLMGVLNI